MNDFDCSFKQIVENSYNPIIITNSKKQIIYINKAFLKETGIKYEEIINTNLNEIYHSHFNLLNIPENDFGEVVIKDSNNQKIYYEVSKNKLYDNKDTIFGCVYYFKNISDWKSSKEKFEKIFEKAPILMSVNTLEDSVFLQVNNAAEKILKISKEKLIGKNAPSLNLLTSENEFRYLNNKIKEDGYVREFEVDAYDAKGNKIHGIFSAETFELKGEKYAIYFFKDLTKLMKRTYQLKTREQLLNNAEIIANMGSWEYDYRTKKFNISKQLYKIFGFKDDSKYLNYNDLLNFFKLKDRNLIIEKVRNAIKNNENFEFDFSIKAKDKKIKHLFGRGNVIFNDENKLEKVIGILMDITNEKEKQKELNMFKEAINDAGYGIYITDRDGYIKFVNPALIKITKYSEKELIGQKTNIWNSGTYSKDYYEDMWNIILDGNTWEDNIINERKDGEKYYAHQIIAPIKNENEKIENFVAIQEDITKQKQAEEKLYEYATFDEMTGALNRRVGIEKLKEYIDISKKIDFKFSICFIDINYLKEINDHLGHKYGDSLLRKTAKYIKKSIREDDHFARMGGDEFLIIFPDCSKNDAEIIWNRILKETEEYNNKKLSPFKISLSHGIVENEENSYNNFDDILTEADERMYKEKEKIKKIQKPF